MFSIQIINFDKPYKFKKTNSDFFGCFFKNIDNYKIAKFYVNLDKTFEYDFAYYFLMLYDFFDNILDFISNDKITFYEVNLYERDDDKIVFLKNKDRVSVNYYEKEEIYNYTYSCSSLKESIINMFKNISIISKMFDLDLIQRNKIDNWIDSQLLPLGISVSKW